MYNADGAKLPEILQGARFDRILMPHPSQSNKFLPAAISMAKEGGWIHYYRHVSAYDLEEAVATLSEELDGILDGKASFKSRKVREIGPRYIELVADIQVARP
jgi:tRNA G37 N-methylase Trm5